MNKTLNSLRSTLRSSLRSPAIGLPGCLALLGCAGPAKLPTTAGVGPQPAIPPPERSLLPTVNVAAAGAWAEGQTPIAGPDLAVAPFAKDLQHPRWMYVLPNGDVLVAETNSPGTEPRTGVRSWVMGKLMGKAGAGVSSPNRIVLLRDADGDGVAEKRSTFLEGLKSPFGMT